MDKRNSETAPLIQLKEINAASIPLNLLLEVDPLKSNIDKYLKGSLCFASFINDEMVGVCVTNIVADGISEVFNISIYSNYQKQGVGNKLLRFTIDQLARKNIAKIVLGTGSFGYQLMFYQRLGFRVDSVEKTFFIDNYDNPIFENDIQHKDMLRLSLRLE